MTMKTKTPYPQMKTNPIRAALKHFALAVPLGVAVWLGAGSSAQAQLPVTSGLVLRMDASQIANGTNGLQLGTWFDTSGLANNAVRQGGSSAGYPQYVTNVVNGLPVVRFNSANNNKGDYFQFTRITTIRTVFWVVKATADGKFLLGDNSSYDFHRGYDGTYLNKIWDSRYAHANIQNGTTKLMGTAVDGTATVLPSGSFQLVSVVTTGNVNANQINQDRTYTGSWQGDIAEILIYNRALTAFEENQVGYYLANKYALTTTYTAPQAPPSDALIHYDLDGVNGTIVTNTGSLGASANGVLQGGSVVAGQFGNALSFSGSGSGIITANTVAIGNAYTFACWVSTANGNSGYKRIILNDYAQSGYLGTDGNGKYLTIVKNQFVSSATSPDTSGAWHHLVMTWDGATQKFYYDGVINTSTAQSQNTTFTERFGFGCNLGAGENWNGKMDDAYVFGRALSAAEVVNLYVNYTPTSIPATPTGVAATPVSSGTVSVSWTASAGAAGYNVSVSNTVSTAVQVISAAASPLSVTGLSNGTLYQFAVQATNSAGASAYSATVSATPALSTAKNILTFLFPGQPDPIISGANINVTMPVGTPVTALAPTYTISALATSSPASGTVRDFTSPQTYTITAEDTSTQVYTVTVTLGAVATNFTWTTGSGGNWSDSTKWVNDLANGIRPATFGLPYYTLNFNQAVTAVNDLSTNYLVNKLNFGNTVTIPAGNSIRFTNNGAILPQINQNSGNQVTIGSPLNLTTNTTLGGSGNGQVNISGNITGAGSLTKTSSGQLQLTGANTFTGGFNIAAGLVYSTTPQNDQSIGPAGAANVTVQSGATLQMERGNCTGTLTLNGGSYSEQNGFNGSWSGSVVLTADSFFPTSFNITVGAVVSGAGRCIPCIA